MAKNLKNLTIELHGRKTDLNLVTLVYKGLADDENGYTKQFAEAVLLKTLPIAEQKAAQLLWERGKSNIVSSGGLEIPPISDIS